MIVAGRDRAPGRGRGADLLARGRPAAGPRRDDQRADPGGRHRPHRRASPPPTRCWRGSAAPWPARSPACRPARLPARPGSASRRRPPRRRVPVLGITGTGGSGKSSLTDELVRRFRTDQQDKLRIAVLAVDPTRRRGGGALLGDRIRMNALDGDHVFFRSLATRGGRRAPRGHRRTSSPPARPPATTWSSWRRPASARATPAVVQLADVSLYVMTPEFGAASQLEKIDMLDFADVVAINKFERRGGADALRDVARQLIRNREAFGASPEDMPVFGTSAATFNDDGVTALYQHLAGLLGRPAACRWPTGVLPRGDRPRVHRAPPRSSRPPGPATWRRSPAPSAATTSRPKSRSRRCGGCSGSPPSGPSSPAMPNGQVAADLEPGRSRRSAEDSAALIAAWPADVAAYSGDEQVVRVRDRELRTALTRESLSGNRVPRVALPRLTDHGELLRFLRRGEPARLLPVHRGGVPVQAGGRGPGPDVRRRGRRVPHQPPVQAGVGRAARRPGCPPRSTR